MGRSSVSTEFHAFACSNLRKKLVPFAEHWSKESRMISIEHSDELIREQIFFDVAELKEILRLNEDLNTQRERIGSIIELLDYLLLTEG